jgi:subtilisin family serine protease
VAPTGGAPDAGIVAVKVIGSNNRFSSLSDVLFGLQYILDERPDVDVVNMSFGTDQLYTGVCDDADASTQAFASLAEELRLAGVLLFASAGNDKSGTTMSAPACLSSVISVGAVYDAELGSQRFFGCTDRNATPDEVSCWSNSNAATDLIAPGALVTTSWRDGLSATFVGTSNASPMAAACAALLMEADPTLTPDEVEFALTSSSTRVTDPKNGLSFPRLDCEEALEILTIGECGDRVDNDGDGLTDYPDDPGCDAAEDASENSPDLPCDDGLDNDGNGLVDYPSEPGCRDLWDPSEKRDCRDGIDNDGDGSIDHPDDPGCHAPSGATESPQCNDGIDNDGDTLIDYPADPNCLYSWSADESWVFNPTCGLGIELTLVLAPLLSLARRRDKRGRSGLGESNLK